jgi:hypothetical protein
MPLTVSERIVQGAETLGIVNNGSIRSTGAILGLMEPDWNLSESDRAIFPALVYAGLKNWMRHYRQTILEAREAELSYVAWLARNIVELRVWVEYCAVSVANSLEFYDDAVRDLVDVNRQNGLQDLDEGSRNTLARATAALPSTKATHKYKNVRDAAEETNMAVYEKNYKLLSKMAHPTAMTVIASRIGESKETAHEISDRSVELADEGLARLEASHLADTYRKYEATMKRMNANLPPERRVILAED